MLPKSYYKYTEDELKFDRTAVRDMLVQSGVQSDIVDVVDDGTGTELVFSQTEPHLKEQIPYGLIIKESKSWFFQLFFNLTIVNVWIMGILCISIPYQVRAGVKLISQQTM